VNKYYLEGELIHEISTISYNVYLEDNQYVSEINKISSKDEYDFHLNNSFIQQLNFFKNFNNIDSVYFDNDFLIIATCSKSHIIKFVFDLTNVKINDKITEIIDYMIEKTAKNNGYIVSKYIPYLLKSITMKNVPIVYNEEIDNIKTFFDEVYDNINKEKKGKDIETFYSKKEAFKYSSILSIITAISSGKASIGLSLFILYNISTYLSCKLGDLLVNSYGFNKYIDFCNKVLDGDIELYGELTEALASEFNKRHLIDNFVIDQLDSNEYKLINSSFVVGLFRDLTILNCLNDYFDTSIKIKLLNLGYEYLLYHSNISINDNIIEKLFTKRLNDIEKSIVIPNNIDNISELEMNFVNNNTFEKNNQKVLTPIIFTNNY